MAAASKVDGSGTGGLLTSNIPELHPPPNVIQFQIGIHSGTLVISPIRSNVRVNLRLENGVWRIHNGGCFVPNGCFSFEWQASQSRIAIERGSETVALISTPFERDAHPLKDGDIIHIDNHKMIFRESPREAGSKNPSVLTVQEIEERRQLLEHVDSVIATLKKESSRWRLKPHHVQVVKEACLSLEQVLPYLEQTKRVEIFSAWIDLILCGKEVFAPLGLTFFRDSLPLLAPEAREALLEQVHRGTQTRQADKVLSAFFLLRDLASALEPAKRMTVYQRAVSTLDRQRKCLDENTKRLHEQLVLLRALQDFANYYAGLHFGVLNGMGRDSKTVSRDNRLIRRIYRNKLMDSNFDIVETLAQVYKLTIFFDKFDRNLLDPYYAPQWDPLQETGLQHEAMVTYLREGKHYIGWVHADKIKEMLDAALFNTDSGQGPFK